MTEIHELLLGDSVKCFKKLCLPNWDGWGRDIPSSGPPQYEEEEYLGTFVYNKILAKFRIKIEGGTEFDLTYFDKIVRI